MKPARWRWTTTDEPNASDRPKGPRDMVSEAAIAVEELIRDRLTQTFPSDSFLGEESVHTNAGDSTGIWVVDPIDGTQPFISGLPN